MKKLLLLLFVLLLIPTHSSANEKSVYKIHPSTSKVSWRGSKVGGGERGTIRVQHGTVTFKGNDLFGGDIVIDMRSLDVTSRSGDSKQKLLGHLRSDDFFAVNAHPTARLVVKHVGFAKGGKYDVSGDLTIRGKTKPIRFSVSSSANGSSARGQGTITIDRTAYGIKYNSAKFFPNLGDKLIHDKFTLRFDLKAHR